jgi:membrane protein DedA with SNARE-associated domain
MRPSQAADDPIAADSATHGPPPSLLQRLEARWPRSTRRRVAVVIALVAIVVATTIASSRLLLLISDNLDLVAYAGLFVTCWIGAGGAIVPVPGVRAFSWFMLVQQGAALDPLIVALVGASAMVLGQTSYFLAARTATRRIEHAEEAKSAEAKSAEASKSAESEATEAKPAEAEPTGRRARYMASAKRRIELQIHNHGMATMFLVTALPSPVTTLATTAAAGEGMSYARFFPAAFGGYLTLCAVLALIGEGLINTVRSLNLF